MRGGCWGMAGNKALPPSFGIGLACLSDVIYQTWLSLLQFCDEL